MSSRIHLVRDAESPAYPVVVLDPRINVHEELGKSRKCLYIQSMGKSNTVCRCSYCGQLLTREQVVQDHFLPARDGGRRGKNLVPSCRTCNTRKGARTILQFRNLCRLYTIPGEVRKVFPISEDTLAAMEAAGVLFPCLPKLSDVRFFFEDPRDDFSPVFSVPKPPAVR